MLHFIPRQRVNHSIHFSLFPLLFSFPPYLLLPLTSPYSSFFFLLPLLQPILFLFSFFHPLLHPFDPLSYPSFPTLSSPPPTIFSLLFPPNLIFPPLLLPYPPLLSSTVPVPLIFPPPTPFPPPSHQPNPLTADCNNLHLHIA